MVIGGCAGKTIFFYATLSFCRLCILHEFEWFMDIDQKKLFQRILFTATLLFILYAIPKYLMIYYQCDHLGFTIFLTSIRNCNLNQLTKNATRHPFVIISIISSFIMEVYIAIKLKKLPWSSLRSITIGHIIMSIWLFASSIKVSRMAMYGIKMPLSFLMFQLLYLLKNREFVLERIKRLCINNNRRVNPDDATLELNDFGVFVGQQISNIPDHETPTSISNEFGNVYIGIEEESLATINKEIKNINQEVKSDTPSNQSEDGFNRELVLSAKSMTEIYAN